MVKSCVAELRETRWLDGQSRQMVRVRIGAAISQAMPGATMLALPVIGQIVLLCYGGWSVMNGRIDLGNLRCVREFSRYADRPYPRTGIVFWLSHSAHRRRWSASSRLSTTRSRMEDGTESVEGQIIGAGRGEDEFSTTTTVTVSSMRSRFSIHRR
ncbi:ATP-binding protein [Salmonella sp. NCTC 11881]|nr:ATP-binding protein [Salmonella sp. NCTC 11881]